MADALAEQHGRDAAMRPSDAPAAATPSGVLLILPILIVGATACTPGLLHQPLSMQYMPALLTLAPLLMAVAVHGWSAAAEASHWLVRKPLCDPAAAQAAAFFQLAAAFALVFGLIGTGVTLVAVLGDLDHPKSLGPGVAAAMMSQLYGVLVATIHSALGAFIARRHGAVDQFARIARRSTVAAGLCVVAGALTTLLAFGILRLSLAPVL